VGAQFCFLFGPLCPHEPAHIAVRNHGGLSWLERATVDSSQGWFVLPNDGLNILIVAPQSDILK